MQEWKKGNAPVAVIMISLNEEHNMESVCKNLSGWAQEVFLVDSYSSDATVDIAISYGVHVVQSPFKGFGGQWNFALDTLPITAPWTMKLDPDERLTDKLKDNLKKSMQKDTSDGFSIDRRLWFMGRPLPIRQRLNRVWRSGNCYFTNVMVNEHPIIKGEIEHIAGDLEHYDSPNLEHWVSKQNNYTTAEAIIAYKKQPLSDTPRLLGNKLQRRMWLKRYFYKLPFRYSILFLYHYLVQGAFLSGRTGFIWAKLRSDVMRLVEYKKIEMENKK
jgi:glycosyltransferase involved in cell wall biosynthesis